MFNRILGSTLFIIGISVGGSILALPIVTNGIELKIITLISISICFIMMISAFWIMELNLSISGNSNLITMAQSTLGKSGAIIMGILYMLLLYFLLSLYLEGGGELIKSLLYQLLGYKLNNYMSTILFITIFSFVFYNGIKIVDWSNRFLMAIKLSSFFLLLIMLIPYESIKNINSIIYHVNSLNFIMPIISAFGFSIIIPSISIYLKKKRKKILLVIILGSIIPLILYLIWIYSIRSTLDSIELYSISQSKNIIFYLSNSLCKNLNSIYIQFLIHIFMSICITTSFLGVSLSMLDFILDIFPKKKIKQYKKIFHFLSINIVFIPPTIIVMLYPGLFIPILQYIGILCIIILIIFPALMNISAIYIKKIILYPPFYCNGFFIIFIFIFAIFALVLSLH